MTFIATRTVTSTGTGSIALGGVISGAGGLTKHGPGTLVMTAGCSYGGATLVEDGLLQLGVAWVLDRLFVETPDLPQGGGA